MRRALAAVLALGLGAAPGARGDDLAEAKASFSRGVERFRERRWAEAMREFRLAHRLKPHGALHFDVAQCQERLEDWPGAIRSYHDYLREVPGAADRDAVEAAVKRLEARLAGTGVQVLLLDSTPPGARVALEGLDRGVTPLHVVLRPGSYAVDLALDGHAPWAGRIEVGTAASARAEVILEPAARSGSAADLAARAPAAPGTAAPPLAAPARPRRYLPAWIAAGAAAAASATALAVSTSARSDERAIDALSSPNGGTASSAASSAASKHRAAKVLYGVAGGAAVAGLTLFLLEWKF